MLKFNKQSFHPRLLEMILGILLGDTLLIQWLVTKEFKKRQRQKSVMSLIKRTKMIVLLVRHAFLNNSLPQPSSQDLSFLSPLSTNLGTRSFSPSNLLQEMTKFKVLTTTWTNYSESLLQIRPYQSSYRTLRSYCIYKQDGIIMKYLK